MNTRRLLCFAADTNEELLLFVSEQAILQQDIQQIVAAQGHFYLFYWSEI